MTTHPIDIEALREKSEALGFYGDRPELCDEVVDGLWAALAAAEHRATRAEAQSEARRISMNYWRESFRDSAQELDRAEARIKAVRELHQQSAPIRRTPRSMRQGHDGDQPFHYCTGCDGARYPCDTIRALDGDA